MRIKYRAFQWNESIISRTIRLSVFTPYPSREDPRKWNKEKNKGKSPTDNRINSSRRKEYIIPWITREVRLKPVEKQIDER